MNYKLEGSGETIVFIHGLSDNLLYWEFLASNLKNDYQVLRIDVRGHGGSELGNDEISIELFVNDLYSLLKELDISKVHLIGFSLGGAVALEFTVMYPETVDSLVLMSSFCKVGEDLANVFVKFRKSLEISFEEFYNLILPMVLCSDVIDNNKEELEMLKDIASQTADTDAYIKAIDACLDFNVESELSEINVSTLVLAGRYDDITSVKSQIELKNKIRNSKIFIFDNLKHNLLVGENNQEILDILKNEYE